MIKWPRRPNDGKEVNDGDNGRHTLAYKIQGGKVRKGMNVYAS